MRKGLTCLAFLLVATAVPQAQALTISFGLDATSIPGLTGFTTSGAMMDGLAVTATFAGGYQETQLWADTGAASGGVSGDNWGLSLTGDTFGAPWTFVNGRDTSLVSLYLNGLNALTVFDITSGGTVGDTPGSAQGWTWVCSSGDCSAADVNVTYNWKVSIGAAAAQGDLWQTVLVEFGANGTDGNFSFIQDTDNDSRLTDPVPEPGTLALLGTGLAATRLLRRRR